MKFVVLTTIVACAVAFSPVPKGHQVKKFDAKKLSNHFKKNGKKVANTKAALTTTTGWFTENYYDVADCSGNAAYTDGTAVGTCITFPTPGESELYTYISSNSTTFVGQYQTWISSADCSGTADSTVQGTFHSKCYADGTVSYNVDFITDGSSLGGGLFYNYGSSSTCATTSFFTFYSDQCVSYDGTSTQSTCSGTSYTVTAYSEANCAGTSASATIDDIYATCTNLETDDYVINSCQAGSSSGDDSSSSCFAGSETVLMESGETQLMSNVQVGDRVLASDAFGNTKFSEVISVPHNKNSASAKFNQIVTAARDVKMTPSHLVMAGACGSEMSLVAAGSVAAGACVQTVAGEEVVLSNEVVVANGVYTIVTKEEMVVVNGVVASPFAVNHAVANAYYNVIRAIHSVAPWFAGLELVKNANHVFGGLVTSM